MKTLVSVIIIVIVFVGLGFWLFSNSSNQSPASAELPGEILAELAGTHIPQDSFEHEPYNSNPPTSGPHWPVAAACRFYDAPLADEQAVHNLEHGSIWITYQPTISAEDKAGLEAIFRRYGNVLVSPRANNDSLIALAAWGRLLKLDSFDENRIIEFIRAYLDQGPERGVACAR